MQDRGVCVYLCVAEEWDKWASLECQVGAWEQGERGIVRVANSKLTPQPTRKQPPSRAHNRTF